MSETPSDDERRRVWREYDAIISDRLTERDATPEELWLFKAIALMPPAHPGRVHRTLPPVSG